jgi:hypothetical protein
MHGMRIVDRCETHAWDRMLDLYLSGEVQGCKVDGYVYLSVRKRRRPAHQLVMERMLGRRLHPGETPHHRNGQRDDNRPENLDLWSTSQPSGQRVADKVAWALELLALYAPETLSDRPVQLRLIG